MSHQDNIRRLILQHNRRLQRLKEKQAQLGLETHVSILIEIEDIEIEIEKLQDELVTLPEVGTRQEEKTKLPFSPDIPLQRPPRDEHFVNRERELSQLLNDLQPGRVATLCGPGGMGKTALAIEALQSSIILERFPDGIIFYSFYGRPDPTLTLEHILTSYGDKAKPTPSDATRRILSSKRTLLVFDGTEEVENLKAVLDVRGAMCGVLITSRNNEDAVNDWQDLTPLPLPETMKLLKNWWDNFEANDNTISSICAMLGGVPLAIRLVGRYLKQKGIPAQEYLEWLGTDPIETLSLGTHQESNIQRLIERNLSQVSMTAQKVMEVVGLFALAPFSREPIVAALEYSKKQIQNALGDLLSYGLLVQIGDRYRVSHALIHTFAKQNRIQPSEVIDRIATYFANLADEQTRLKSDSFAKEDDHLHTMAILNQCIKHEQWEAGHSLAWAISNQDGYLRVHGHWTERLIVAQKGLDIARRLEQRQNEARFLIILGHTRWSLGDIQKAIENFEQALAISRIFGYREDEGDALGHLGLAHRDLGKNQQAIDYYQQAIDISREVRDERQVGIWLGNLGNTYFVVGQTDLALKYLKDALTIAHDLGYRRNEGNWLGNLGRIFLKLGQIEQAITHFQQALNIAQDINDRRNEEYWLSYLGKVYYRLGQLEQALDYHQQALDIGREIGDRLGQALVLNDMGLVYRDLTQIVEAKTCWQQALAIFTEIKSPYADQVRESLGKLSF